MAKYFIDVVQDSPTTGLGIPVESKKSLYRSITPPTEPPFSFKPRRQLVPTESRVRLFCRPFARDFHPRPHARWGY